MLKRRGVRTDPCGTPFLRRRNLLLLLFPVVRVKLRLLRKVTGLSVATAVAFPFSLLQVNYLPV